MTTVQDFGDPFNWKFPSRNDTMSLQTITKKDAGFQQYEQSVRDANLLTKDIRGASPELKPYKYTNKESFLNQTQDISGTQPKKLNQFTNKTNFQLKTDDIEGTKTQVFSFKTVRQPTNPLEPKYKLPVVEQRPVTPPKFIRDTLNIQDIDGSRPNPKVFQPRKEDIYTEIEGSKTKPKFIPQQHIDSLNVADINQYKRFISTRTTNPLLPTYEVPKEKSNYYNKFSSFYDTKSGYGEIKGSQSKRLHPLNQTGQNFNYNVNDIEGTKADTHSDFFLKRSVRKDYRSINETKDMPWANAGSLKKGIQTIRSVNPLQPEYQLPGEIEAQQEQLEEMRSKFPQTTKQASSQASQNDIQRAGTQMGMRRASQSSQQSFQQQKQKISQTTTNFRPQRPKYDTLGNKIKHYNQPKQDTQYCQTHDKHEPKSRSGITPSQTGNLTSAQKMDKFLN